MVIRIINLLLFAAVVSLMSTSCKRDTDFSRLKADDWNPEWAIPLITASYGIEELLTDLDDPDQLLVTDPLTGLVSVVYKGKLLSFAPEEFLSLPNQSFSGGYQLNTGEAVELMAGITVTIQETVFLPVALDNEMWLDELLFKSGQFMINIQSDFPVSITGQLVFPGLLHNQQSYTIPIELDGTAAVPVTSAHQQNLAGMLLTTASDKTVEVRTTLTFHASQNVTLTGNEQISYQMQWNQIGFSHVKGYFGTRSLMYDRDTVHLTIFNKIETGFFQFTDPRIHVSIDNSFGIPANIHVEQLLSVNTITMQESELLLEAFENPFPIAFPSQLDQTANTHVLINNENSNLQELTNSSPKFMVAEFSGTVNPMGTPVTQNFVTDASSLTVDLEVELPLEGYAYDFVIRDTGSVNIDRQVDHIESLMFRLNFTNGFPIDFTAQVYFYDQQFQLIDSLLHDSQSGIILSAPTDAEGRVTQSVNTISDIELDVHRAAALKDARYLVFYGKAETRNALAQPPHIVRLYEDYRMDLKIGMMIKAKVIF